MNHPQLITPLVQNESRTVRQALSWAGSYLRDKGLPDPRLSAELLLGSVMGLDRLGLIVHSQQSLDKKEGFLFQEKILRRAEHEPVAYLTGTKEFWSLNFQVNPEVLIPRPETEMLVEQTQKIISIQPGPLTLIELGTGSGAVAVALAKSINPPKPIGILATDISGAALNTARENAISHGVENRIHLVQGDWLRPFSSRSRWIDFLVSNPPYISEQEMRSLPTTVKKYEPIKALSGGLDGLEAIRQIFHQAITHLKIGGWLLLEIGATQGPQLLSLAQTHHFNPITILRDHAGRDRVLKACYHG